VGRWRKDEDWGGAGSKIDRRAAELFVEKISSHLEWSSGSRN
jgi:hypothetical protein